MQKGKINITMDRDLIEYAKTYAEEQRTDVFWSLHHNSSQREKSKGAVLLKYHGRRAQDSLLETISRVRTGDIKWASVMKSLLMDVRFSDCFCDSVKKHAALRNGRSKQSGYDHGKSGADGRTAEGKISRGYYRLSCEKEFHHYLSVLPRLRRKKDQVIVLCLIVRHAGMKTIKFYLARSLWQGLPEGIETSRPQD